MWGDDENILRPKCELILLYLGHGRYDEYISVLTPDQDVLQLTDLSANKKTTSETTMPATKPDTINKPTTPKPKLKIRAKLKSHSIQTMPSDIPTSPKKRPQWNKCTSVEVIDVIDESTTNKRVTRPKRCINYADLNLGIDSNDEQFPPRKHKPSKALALREPSQTVITARNQ